MLLRYQNQNNRRGFTLIEIILVLMILTVITALSAPNFKNTYKQLQLKKTTEDIVYLMRYAQSRAIIKNVTVQLVFEDSLHKYWLTQQTASGDFDRFHSRMGRSYSIPENIIIDSEELALNFHSDGSIAKIRFYVCDKSEKCFTVSTREQRGTVNIYEGKVL